MKTIHALAGCALLLAAGAASAGNCSITLDSNDRMQFDARAVEVSAGCAEVTIELHHSGKLPKAAMGHNVVVTAASDAAAVAVRFPGRALRAGTDYVFFCSFPGHSALMRGTLAVR
jgi:azurin